MSEKLEELRKAAGEPTTCKPEPWTVSSAREMLKRGEGCDIAEALDWALDQLEAIDKRLVAAQIAALGEEGACVRCGADAALISVPDHGMLCRECLLARIKWRPIETGPKDDTRVELWEPDRGPGDVPKATGWSVIGKWRRLYEPDGPEGYYEGEMSDEPVHATHWRPLGPGPEGK